MVRMKKILSAVLLGIGLAGSAHLATAQRQMSPMAGNPVSSWRQLTSMGKACPVIPERAAELYCDAVRSGSAEAMYNLAGAGAIGRGVGGTTDTPQPCLKWPWSKGMAGAEKARRLVGDYTGAVPECLKATFGRTGLQ